ncbi:hypothetical protein SASPL_113249 [Salvia splendens]|uniref:BZIP domain-containing protein n=1 Tax=Salvia splendens TaxID=180675 RepID=A0A8X8ZY72_SALSN|nr:hypothetical protein SASPL_113249 [Salvia splendens]
MNTNTRSSLPPSGRSSVLPFQPNRSYSTKPEQPASPNFGPIGLECSSKQDHKMSSHASPFSSEISRIFDGDLGIVGGLDGISCFDETEEDLLPKYLDLDGSNSISENCALPKEKLSILPQRIWANRQSAARSKERKMRYIAELQSKVQSSQTDKASLSMQFALMQENTNCVASENIELKLQLQSFERQEQLQDALNEAMRDEIRHLKVLTGQAMPNGHNPTPYGANQNYHHNSHAQPLQHQLRQHQLDQFQPRQLLLH